MKYVKEIGCVVLGVYLVLLGLAGFFGFHVNANIYHLLEVVAGAFILLGVWTCCKTCCAKDKFDER